MDEVLFAFMVTLGLAHGWYAEVRGEIPAPVTLAAWLTITAAPVYVIDTTEDPITQAAGVVLMAFILTLAYQMRDVRGPGKPDGYKPVSELGGGVDD